MSHATDDITTNLKNAREAKGLSQRALSGLTGVPQSHISKIEKGAVDLRVSSLVELARGLDLELTLVPRKSLPAVNAIIRSTRSKPPRLDEQNATIRKELKRLQTNLENALRKYPANTELAQFQRAVRDLNNFPFAVIEPERLRDANRAIDMFIEQEDEDGLRHSLIEVKNLRNAAAHTTASTPADTVRPAYALEEDDRGE
ncbi:MAG TPA: helix-turn-helix transcriptional regulator [Gammaproteobacteria bacterium]|nr:helix-turn-helix transcriptional regulator [Gammaproteobacteria bacterium]